MRSPPHKDERMDWYYKDGDVKVGPVSDDQIKQLASHGKITTETQVWNEITLRWLPYGQIVGCISTMPPEIIQPKTAGPEKTEGKIGDSYDDTYSDEVFHKPDDAQTAREREATAVCSNCTKEAAWNTIHATAHGLVCDACFRRYWA